MIIYLWIMVERSKIYYRILCFKRFFEKNLVNIMKKPEIRLNVWTMKTCLLTEMKGDKLCCMWVLIWVHPR